MNLIFYLKLSHVGHLSLILFTYTPFYSFLFDFLLSYAFLTNIFIIEQYCVMACHKIHTHTYTFCQHLIEIYIHKHMRTQTHTSQFRFLLSLIFLSQSRFQQRLILLACQCGRELAVLICQTSLWASYSQSANQAAAQPPTKQRRQQNGLKNLSAVKHLRHVFNNVVYNVDFFPLFLDDVVVVVVFVVVVLSAFWMNLYRMPFMAFGAVARNKCH